ncbi:hypothetical protein [Sphingomonas zeae]|jgi:hypothetical protein|uniref:Uncharacterized protein n=3 Tax=Sphingomonadaceae TaxID=41297 RepID=A0A7Y6EFB5_9SPHN|nr:hypothetical protein [Sphingomonas zeae]MDK8188280.1 hypothetical protein [Sphingomonas zeae]NUU45593.1 hypothetical protein [Sphingomonas zeae]
MMTDPFDRDLARLAHSTPPPTLDGLERRVATAIDAGVSDTGGLSVHGLALAGGVALMLGIVGGGAVAGRIEARERPVAVAALDAGLAPSTLLLGR